MNSLPKTLFRVVCCPATLACLGMVMAWSMAHADVPNSRTTRAKSADATELTEQWSFEAGSEGSVGTIGISKGPIQTTIIRTKRSFGEVWSFYAKKIGCKKKHEPKQLHYHHGEAKGGRFFIRDVPTGKKPRRTMFVFDCPGHTTTATAHETEQGVVVYLTVVARK